MVFTVKPKPATRVASIKGGTYRATEQSTGPKTKEGKSTVAGNAWPCGQREKLRALSKMVNEELRQARELVASCYA